MDNQKIIRWICSDPNCELGRVIDTVPELLLHSQNKHKLIKYDKFRETIVKFFDDSNISRLYNEQHFTSIIHNIQNLITFLKDSVTNLENQYQQIFKEFYEKLHPRQMIIRVTESILNSEQIEKDALNQYLEMYFQKFDINPQTQQQLDQLQNQIQNFCQSQKIDLISLFEKQLLIREPPIIQMNYQLDQFDVQLSSQNVVFDNLSRSATSHNLAQVYYKGTQEQNKVIMKIEVKILNLDDYIFKVGVVTNNHNLQDYEGCYLLTQSGVLLKEQDTQQSKLRIQDGSHIKVRYSKKHPKKIFFQVDNNLNDKILLDQVVNQFNFIIIMQNIQVRLI